MGFDLFKNIAHGGLGGPGEVSSKLCSLKDLVGLSFKQCKSLRKILKGFRGVDLFEEIIHVGDCEAVEECPFGICTLKAWRKMPKGLGGGNVWKNWDSETLEGLRLGL